MGGETSEVPQREIPTSPAHRRPELAPTVSDKEFGASLEQTEETVLVKPPVSESEATEVETRRQAPPPVETATAGPSPSEPI